MQNNFECIFKLIVALTFLMCVVCLHYQYSFFHVLHYSIFILRFCLFYSLVRKTEKMKKKERKKQRK